MRIVELARTVPVLLWGPPGVGKTATVVAEAEEAGLPIEVVVASIRDPTDFGGLPVRGEKGVALLPPAFAVRLAEAGRGVLFLDELNTCPPAVQAALLRVVLDRAVGDLRLPDDVIIIAAANPPDLAASGWDLAPPLANRFVHLEFELHPEEWAARFPTYWGKPPRVDGLEEAAWGRARAAVAAFIRRRPELLLCVPKERSRRGQAWPSPRTWDYASRILALFGPTEAAFRGIVGAVGEAGLECIAWLKNANLPLPEEVLKQGERFVLPERLDVAYAVLSSVAAYVQAHPTVENWTAAWKVLAKAAQDGAADVAAVAAKSVADLRAQNPRLPLPVEEIQPFLPVLGLGEGR